MIIWHLIESIMAHRADPIYRWSLHINFQSYSQFNEFWKCNLVFDRIKNTKHVSFVCVFSFWKNAIWAQRKVPLAKKTTLKNIRLPARGENWELNRARPYSTTHLNSKIRHGDPDFKNDKKYCPMSSHFQFFARTFAEETWGSPSIAPQAKKHTKQSSKLIKAPILVFIFISKKKLYGRPDI